MMGVGGNIFHLLLRMMKLLSQNVSFQMDELYYLAIHMSFYSTHLNIRLKCLMLNYFKPMNETEKKLQVTLFPLETALVIYSIS